MAETAVKNDSRIPTHQTIVDRAPALIPLLRERAPLDGVPTPREVVERMMRAR